MILKVGDVVPDAQALAALPVGAAVTEANGYKLWTKHATKQWGRHQDHTERFGEDYIWFRGQVLISLPGPVYEGPQVGDKIETADQLAALPVNSTISLRNRSDLQKNDEGRWCDTDGDHITVREILTESWHVQSVADVGIETVEAFSWRFRDLAITGAERAQGDSRNAIKVLQGLKSEFNPSVGMRIVNQYDRRQLPDGTRVYVGNPEDVASFGLFVKSDGAWRHLLGDREDPNREPCLVVDALPDTEEPAEWMTRTPTTEDAEKIVHLRAKAWKVGYAEKLSRGWCEEFERIMLRGGISADSARVLEKVGGFTCGTALTPEQVATLPVGSLFRFKDEADPNRWALFARVQDSTNRAGTKRIAASTGQGKPIGHFADRMTLLAGPNVDDLELQVVSWDEMEAMPVGTRMFAGGSRYWKKANGKWTRTEREDAEGEYRPDQFGNPRNGYTYQHIPVT